MASSSSTARAVYRQYSNNSSENLPPRTLARLAREVRDLHKNPPEGVRLVVDCDSGLPANLAELMVRSKQSKRPNRSWSIAAAPLELNAVRCDIRFNGSDIIRVYLMLNCEHLLAFNGR